MDQHPQANLAIVHQRTAAGSEGSLRSVVAGAVASMAAQTAFVASAAVDVGFEVEERRRVEIVGLLAAAADVADGGAHAEQERERDGERVTTMTGSVVQGSTS
jgi:hypothetical protein